MRAGNRSRTSDWVAALRALYTEAPPDLAVVDDPAAAALVPPALSALVRVGARVPFGVRGLHRVIGAASLGLSYGIPLRTAAIDDVIRRSLAEGTDQLVVVGAGLDARAWRMPELEQTDVYELDHPATQAYKRERIGELSPLAREVHHVAIDFERQSIAELLASTSFAPERPSIWIWEGVTMYLTRAAIDATLDAIAALCAPGGRLATTYVPPDFGGPLKLAIGKLGASLIGEPLEGMLAPGEIASLLEQRGFRVESDESAPDWAAQLWRSSDAARVRAYERLVVATAGRQ